MKITRKRELIIERERRVTIRFNDASREIFCEACEMPARFITVDEAATVRGTSARAIFRMVEAGQIHFLETAHGRLIVCLASLTNLSNERGKSLEKSNE